MTVHAFLKYTRGENGEVSKELKFSTKGEEKYSVKKQLRNWVGPALKDSDKRKEEKRIGGAAAGMEGKARQQLRLETEELLQMVLTAAKHPPKGAGVQGGLPQEVDGERRCAPPVYSSTDKGGVEEAARGRESTGLRVGCWGKALGGRRAARRSRASAGRWEINAAPAQKAGARAAPQGSAGRKGPGEWGRGGRGPLTITNRSPFQPQALSHRLPATLDVLTQTEGPAGPKRLRRRRVARLSLAQSRRPGSGASLLGPQHQQQHPHFRYSCHSGKWLPEVPPHPAWP